MKWILLILSSLALATPAQAQSLPAEVVRYAETVLHNGKIITVDEQFSIAEAIAVRDGKILRVGRDADVLPLAGPAPAGSTFKAEL